MIPYNFLGFDDQIRKVNPVFCMPQEVIDNLEVEMQMLTL